MVVRMHAEGPSMATLASYLKLSFLLVNDNLISIFIRPNCKMIAKFKSSSHNLEIGCHDRMTLSLDYAKSSLADVHTLISLNFVLLGTVHCLLYTIMYSIIIIITYVDSLISTYG